jgi:putative transcriptional regulator
MNGEEVKNKEDFEKRLDELTNEIDSVKNIVKDIVNNRNNMAHDINPLKEKVNYKIINNLKELIATSPYNQKQIAEMINISQKTLSNILTNRYNTSLEVALKLSCIFGKSVNEIFKLVPIEK